MEDELYRLVVWILSHLLLPLIFAAYTGIIAARFIQFTSLKKNIFDIILDLSNALNYGPDSDSDVIEYTEEQKMKLLSAVEAIECLIPSFIYYGHDKSVRMIEKIIEDMKKCPTVKFQDLYFEDEDRTVEFGLHPLALWCRDMEKVSPSIWALITPFSRNF